MKKIVFVLSAFVFFACGSANSPEKILEKFVKSSMDGTISENTNIVANDDGSPLEEKAAKELVNLVDGIRQYKMKEMKVEKLTVDKVEVVNVEYNEANSKARLEYITTVNGVKEDKTSTQYMIKGADGWKIVVMVRGNSWLNR